MGSTLRAVNRTIRSASRKYLLRPEVSRKPRRFRPVRGNDTDGSQVLTTRPANTARTRSAPAATIQYSQVVTLSTPPFSAGEVEQVLNLEQLARYFPGQTNTANRKVILDAINLIWEKGYLFLENDFPYAAYIELLKSIVEANKDFFSVQSIDGYSNNGFRNEFFKLTTHGYLDEQTRAICLTQALELALMGVGITTVVKEINATRKNKDCAKGYRQELLAGWFLAKSIYPTVSDSPNLYQLRQGIKFDINYNGKPSIGREIDVVGPDALVEVKHHADADKARPGDPTESPESKLAKEICDLFEVVVGSSAGTGLKKKIKKLMLVVGSNDENMWYPHYDDKFLQVRVAHKARTALGRSLPANFYYLVSTNAVKVYYIPSVMNHENLKKWIEQLYVHSKPAHKTEHVA